MLRQLTRFSVVGVVNTLVGISVIYLVKYWFGIGNISANVLGYSAGLVVSFLLNKGWTFGYKGGGRAAVRFVGVFAIAYLLNLVAVVAAIDVVNVNAYIAQAMGILPYTLSFFLLSKFYVFRVHPKDQMTRPVSTMEDG